MLAGDVAKGIGGAGEGLVSAVAVGGGIAQRVVFLAADGVALVLEQQHAAVGFHELGHAAVVVVVVLAHAASGVRHAGALSVEVIVQRVAHIEAVGLLEGATVLVVLELGGHRLAVTLQGLGDAGQQVLGRVVAVRQHLRQGVGHRLQVARRVVGVAPLARGPVGHILEPAIGVIAEGDACAATDAEVVGDVGQAPIAVVAQRKAVAPRVVDVLEASNHARRGFEVARRHLKDVLDAVAKGQRVLTGAGAVQRKRVVHALWRRDGEAGFVDQVALLSTTFVGVGDGAGLAVAVFSFLAGGAVGAVAEIVGLQAHHVAVHPAIT